MPETKRPPGTAVPALRASAAAALPRLQLKKISWAWLAFVTTCFALLAVGAPLNVNLYKMALPFGLGMAIFHTATLALTVVRPLPGALLSLIPLGVLPLVTDSMVRAPMPFSVVAMLTEVLVICVAALRSRWSLPAVTWLLSIGVGVAVNYRGMPEVVPQAGATNVVVYASVSGGLLVAAVVTRQWQNIRKQLMAEKTLSAEEQSMRRLAEERARIARELHDVVAHGMSIVVVQATTAQYRHPDLSAPLKNEFDEIAANSRRAMTEMRSMLGALRSDRGARELAPQPGVSDIPQLMAAARTAGITVEGPTAESFDASGLSEVISLTAYRITQEALSNVIRHSPGSRTTVSLLLTGPNLQVEVSNGPSGIGAVLAQLDRANSGQGIVGMRERANIVGGSLVCVPVGGGGFSVTATLPLTPTEAGSGR
ncbi:histidine kinase [Paenarthrobacter sp. Z7-10]|uniref:sensor histidine kinase n=1 Tax=Paenarthrobacter sp. Z7-10 TaxID=2787635 RepID=UPI0022A93500|nr:histidine kinase [Paenarthrobacter sp. Z7-10]MCZ2402260.1 histidine kinase [Paenarthrobacter sp. Z7-10]